MSDRAAHLDARDLAALHRALEWLAKDDGRRMTVDYCEGEVRVVFDRVGLRRLERGALAFVGQSSDFAGAIDDCESDGWAG